MKIKSKSIKPFNSLEKNQTSACTTSVTTSALFIVFLKTYQVIRSREEFFSIFLFCFLLLTGHVNANANANGFSHLCVYYTKGCKNVLWTALRLQGGPEATVTRYRESDETGQAGAS